jgi:hypothetical protein
VVAAEQFPEPADPAEPAFPHRISAGKGWSLRLNLFLIQ